MSESGSNVTKEVKVTDKVESKKESDQENKSQIKEEDTISRSITDDMNAKQETDIHSESATTQQNRNEGETTDITDSQKTVDATDAANEDLTAENQNENTKDLEVLAIDKESDAEEGQVEESCLKIDKIDSNTKSEEQTKIKGGEPSQESKKSAKTESKSSKSEDSKKGVVEQKPLKPKTTLTTLAKMPALTGASVGGVRLLSGGVRGTNVPLLLSMGAGTAGIPLLPAGLPPGRYVILPGTSSTTKTTCATVNTTSGSMAPRLATGVAPPVASVAATVVPATSTTTVNVVAAAAAAAAVAARTRSITPTLQIPTRSHARERGRRKSYTTGEKLAMIEAVEAGQRKSTVADRFGVAPSTLACILAQKNKIRAEQDNLSRRRFRHMKYLQDEGRGSSSSRATPSIVVTPTLQTLTSTADQPFTHFLASLTAPANPVFDSNTQPEEIIAVPDLMERIDGGGGGGESTSAENDGKDDDLCDDDDGLSGIECLGVIPTTSSTSIAVDSQQESILKTRKALRMQNTDALEESSSQEISERPSSPPSSTQGLTGPYLLKKETHCSTVLDQLLRDDTYTDVTLTAEGLSLRAHRIVLCLASPYFRQVLSREQNVQSVVLLRDVKFAELRNIINFIYTGEATVDAADLESFMRTAEMLEITSLCEGQKYISSRGLSQGGSASSFTIGDFERLVGTKDLCKEASPPPSKSRKLSGEDPSSRCSSPDPSAATNVLDLIKEEPDCDLPSTSQTENAVKEKAFPVSTNGETAKDENGKSRKKRKRRDSSESIGGFAAIAGVQKVEADDEDEVFTTVTKSSQNQQVEDNCKPACNDVDNTATPGRCPYCPHVSQTFEGVSMMRHLLVSHPCKPAFPCSFCWRVFVKRSNFKVHLQSCEDSY